MITRIFDFYKELYYIIDIIYIIDVIDDNTINFL